MNRSSVNRASILLIVLVVSILFVSMIRRFIMAIILAGIFSAMAQPIYKRFERWFRGRKSLASIVTLLIVLLIIFLPLAGVLGIVTGQAIKISQSVTPWIEQWARKPSALDELFGYLPFSEQLYAYRNLILQKAGQIVGSLSTTLFNSISAITVMTLYSIFLLLIFFYTMFFFLRDGRGILDRVLHYLPLPDTAEKRLLDRFTSVTRATLKGTLLIGLIQGSLAGFAFWVVGIDSALFWGTIMTFLSIIPSVGSALVWLPAAIILAVSGEYARAAGLFAFCAFLVGSIDNVLRPWIVGRDVQLHELLIFFGTLGGISMFGLMGFIIGPIIAALFVTIWDIYAENFKDYLSDAKRYDE
ncbi:MAG TPA: AI-2E family transporter [Deltaproteobacteria bacterium]|jgi:predicted PurR-regulated permease PerM|nr:AI-2E family transporter [Deltaproteobacteria bacterium]HQI01940.1 AI-2E family transporter [Deltaproteobacteria bacterium]HQJ08515.1 AI-2E family transporter [Deltaproteobacteria bacterium]